MAIGTFGVTRPADVSINDIEIYYNYTPNRETENNVIIKIDDPQELISNNYLPDGDDNNIPNTENLLEGLYNLKLPATIFNQLGIYTIYIKPKMLNTVIVDCSVLSSLPNVKGIILDVNSLPDNLRANNALQGHRIEYIDTTNGTKIRNLVRYVVTSNKVVPVTENVGNTTQRTTRYRFDDSGTLLFLQLTPSSGSDVKPNTTPFIGVAGQTILLSNTYFSPVVMEIEMVENDLNSLTELVAGNTINDLDNGLLTQYDSDNNEILRQFNLFTLKDDISGTELYQIKERRTTIDPSQEWDEINNI